MKTSAPNPVGRPPKLKPLPTPTIVDLTPKINHPPTPETLGIVGREIWIKLWGSQKHLNFDQHSHKVQDLCELYDRLDFTKTQLLLGKMGGGEDLFYHPKNQHPAPHALLKIEQETRQQIRAIENDLLLTPAASAKAGQETTASNGQELINTLTSAANEIRAAAKVKKTTEEKMLEKFGNTEQGAKND